MPITSEDKEVIIDYASLGQNKEQLKQELHDKGYIIVRGVPNHPEYYNNFLKEAIKFAKLPENEKQKCSNPTRSHSHGWSNGIEKFNGKIDSYKGSFYADMVKSEYPDEINIWPTQLPDFEKVYMKLGNLVFNVGQEILEILGFGFKELDIKMRCKTRMLYYQTSKKEDCNNELWCGKHKDHGLLTGLCPAMFYDINFNIIDMTGTDVGLIIRGKNVKIPKDCLAFQVGEVGQMLSNGEIKATEHWVNKGYDCQRITFVGFTDIPEDYEITTTDPEYINDERYYPGIHYHEFSEKSYTLYNKIR